MSFQNLHSELERPFFSPRVENIWIWKLAFRLKEDYSRQSQLEGKIGV